MVLSAFGTVCNLQLNHTQGVKDDPRSGNSTPLQPSLELDPGGPQEPRTHHSTCAALGKGCGTARKGGISVKFDWKLWAQSLNWKLIVLRIMLAAVAVALTVLIGACTRVPEYVYGAILILGAAFGFLNAFVKPLIQVVTP